MPEPDLRLRIWEWLPARSDRRRITDAAAIAAALDVPRPLISVFLARMEREGYVIRNATTGRLAGWWHRGTNPIPPAAPATHEELTLWP